jgi:hypothetical protein
MRRREGTVRGGERGAVRGERRETGEEANGKGERGMRNKKGKAWGDEEIVVGRGNNESEGS